MNLNKLDYPMFKITVTQALLLIEARKRIAKKLNSRVCYAVSYAAEDLGLGYGGTEPIRLRKKVCASILGNGLLENFFGYQTNCSQQYELRKIWIKKLLAHNGY
jgi:hypothetical protein